MTSARCLASGCTEQENAAAIVIDCRQRWFSTQISTQKAARRSREIISPGHGGKRGRPARVCHQPSKLVMRVRFPSPAPCFWSSVTNSEFLFGLLLPCVVY